MSESLRDQLLKMGLANKQQFKDAKTASREQKRQVNQAKKTGEKVVSEAAKAAQEAAAQKRVRDKEIARKQQALRAEREREARLKNLIEHHEVQRKKGDIPFNFTHGTLVKRLYVNAEQQRQLVRGKLGIAFQDDAYHLVPFDVVERLREADPEAVVHLAPPMADDDEGDHPIPDDLMW